MTFLISGSVLTFFEGFLAVVRGGESSRQAKARMGDGELFQFFQLIFYLSV